MRNLRWPVAASVVALVALSGCGGTGDQPEAPAGQEPESQTLTVYSGREEELVGDLLSRFESDSGIDLDVRYGDSAELAATILEEGESSPADVFFSQDAGSLGAVAEAGLFQGLDGEILDRVDERFRSADGSWVGTSGRARVAAYNTDRLDPADLPDTILAFAEPEWKGRIGFPPTNSSFQAFVAAMIELEGEDATRAFLEGLQANDPTLYEDNSSTVRGIAAGEIEVGFVNHYYLYEVGAEEGDIPVANHFFTGGDPGALVNAAGVGILGTTDAEEAAQQFVDYLTGDEGQRFFAEDTFEYPVVPGLEPSVELVPLEEIESPDVDLSNLGATIEPALDLLAEVGLL